LPRTTHVEVALAHNDCLRIGPKAGAEQNGQRINNSFHMRCTREG